MIYFLSEINKDKGTVVIKNRLDTKEIPLSDIEKYMVKGYNRITHQLQLSSYDDLVKYKVSRSKLLGNPLTEQDLTYSYFKNFEVIPVSDYEATLKISFEKDELCYIVPTVVVDYELAISCVFDKYYDKAKELYINLVYDIRGDYDEVRFSPCERVTAVAFNYMSEEERKRIITNKIILKSITFTENTDLSNIGIIQGMFDFGEFGNMTVEPNVAIDMSNLTVNSGILMCAMFGSELPYDIEFPKVLTGEKLSWDSDGLDSLRLSKFILRREGQYKTFDKLVEYFVDEKEKEDVIATVSGCTVENLISYPLNKYKTQVPYLEFTMPYEEITTERVNPNALYITNKVIIANQKFFGFIKQLSDATIEDMMTYIKSKINIEFDDCVYISGIRYKNGYNDYRDSVVEPFLKEYESELKVVNGYNACAVYSKVDRAKYGTCINFIESFEDLTSEQNILLQVLTVFLTNARHIEKGATCIIHTKHR